MMEGGDSKDKKHTSVLSMTVPKDTRELQVAIKAMAESLADYSKQTTRPLALVAWAIVDENGMMPAMCKAFGKSMDIQEERLAFALLCAFGKCVFDAEKKTVKDLMKLDGLEKLNGDWIREHIQLFSFAGTAWCMEELTCDCPGCIMFWSVKRYLEDAAPQTVVDEICAVVETEPEWGNPGCVRHKIDDSDAIKWQYFKEE